MNNNQSMLFLIILTAATFSITYLQFYYTYGQIDTEFQQIRKECENEHYFEFVQDSMAQSYLPEIPPQTKVTVLDFDTVIVQPHHIVLVDSTAE